MKTATKLPKDADGISEGTGRIKRPDCQNWQIALNALRLQTLHPEPEELHISSK